ncbi:MAG TPA: VCBS repeat-containing protein, partial [Candidatus Angelobacter sp.]|nr:VCBS repeat-containing protein [Candidatus Angelobacter sp.]
MKRPYSRPSVSPLIVFSLALALSSPLALLASDSSASPLLGAPFLSFDTGSGPAMVAVADLNADGISDLVFADFDANSVSILLGNGDGTFGPRTDYPTGTNPVTSLGNPFSLAIADVNSDGKSDLV